MAIIAVTATPAAATDHPRLLIDGKDLQALRAKVKNEPYASMLKAMETELANSLEEAAGKPKTDGGGLMYNFAPRNQAALYLLTGEQKYAADGEKICLEMVNEKDFWNNPGSKGLTRAAGALTVALAYDACQDAWAPTNRMLISQKLRFAADKLMASMGAGANTRTANNWQAVRYGAAGLAALSSDEDGGDKVAKDCYGQLKRHLTENLSENGWNPEGVGYTNYPWGFTGPFGIAAAKAGIGDLRTDVKKATMTFWAAMAGSVAIPRGNGPTGARGADGTSGLGLHGDLSDDNAHYSPDGTGGLAFFYAPEKYRPGIKWMYDHLVGNDGSKTFDTSAGGGLYSILLYPHDLPAQNPAETCGLTYVDRQQGVAIFRNQFKDENDIVVLANAHSRQPAGAHGGPDTNTFRILGLGSFWATGSGRGGAIGGQTNLFPADPTTFNHKLPKGSPPEFGKLTTVDFSANGGGTCTLDGTSMGVKDHVRALGVDFSGMSGAPAVIVNAETSGDGKFWRLNVPEFNTIKTSGNQFIITAPNGATLVGTVIEPATPSFRTGTVRRDNPSDEHGIGIDFRGKKYRQNNWVDFECDKNALVVLTLQPAGKAAPKVEGKGSATDASVTVGGQNVSLAGGRMTLSQ